MTMGRVRVAGSSVADHSCAGTRSCSAGSRSPNTLRAALIVLAASTLLLTTPGCSDDATQRPTRLVLISLDTLRADRFDADRMPALTAAAEGGLVFHHFHAATSVTLPTHVSMLSGLHPWQHGVLRNGVIVREDVTLLAERLHDAGFSTAAVVASFPLERRFRFDQGFDTYIDAFLQPSAKGTWNEEEVPDALFSSPADVIADDALRLIDEASGDQQFFFFHFFDPHAPYGDSRAAAGVTPLELGDVLSKARNQSPGLEKIIARAERLYDDDVRFLDAALDRILTRLAADDRYETHVLITADHGESFGDDGSLGHGKRLSLPQVHVPFVLLSPRAQAGVRTDVAGSVDVTPTLMALAGLSPDDSLAGRDLLGPVPVDARALGMRSVFDGAQRDIRTDGRALPVDALRFYLAREGSHVVGGETGELDVVGEGVAEAAQIRRLFTDFAAEVRARMTEMVESADPETRAALEALGYTR